MWAKRGAPRMRASVLKQFKKADRRKKINFDHSAVFSLLVSIVSVSMWILWCPFISNRAYFTFEVMFTFYLSSERPWTWDPCFYIFSWFFLFCHGVFLPLCVCIGWEHSAHLCLAPRSHGNCAAPPESRRWQGRQKWCKRPWVSESKRIAHTHVHEKGAGVEEEATRPLHKVGLLYMCLGARGAGLL